MSSYRGVRFPVLASLWRGEGCSTFSSGSPCLKEGVVSVLLRSGSGRSSLCSSSSGSRPVSSKSVPLDEGAIGEGSAMSLGLETMGDCRGGCR